MTNLKESLELLIQKSGKIDKHYLRSSNVSTKVLLVATYAVLDTVSRLTKYGEVSANGVDPSVLETKIYCWADGISKQIGDVEFCAVLLGALRRAVTALEAAVGVTKNQE